jgi:hypothetical protein
MDKGGQKLGILIILESKAQNKALPFSHWGSTVARLIDSGSTQPVVEVVFRIISQNRYSHASFTRPPIHSYDPPSQPPRTDLDFILQQFPFSLLPHSFQCRLLYLCCNIRCCPLCGNQSLFRLRLESLFSAAETRTRDMLACNIQVATMLAVSFLWLEQT